MVIENGDAIVSKIFMSGDQNLRDKHILNNNSKELMQQGHCNELNNFHITVLQFIHTASTAASAGPLILVREDSMRRR